ncbi:MAG TPA: heme lyase CcmF/NrfE family subunit, partial [Chloroflexi bacterium]|nr:heme lyase CcmF/NrfE family subunit [Chloroflexota bacterium]
MAKIGYAALLISLAISLYSIEAFLLGLKHNSPKFIKSAERGIWAIGGLVTVASLALVYLLLSRDFSVYYVYRYTSTFQPAIYALSAFWAGQEGSLLLWLWLLSILSIIAVLNRQGWNRTIQSYALIVLALIEAFFSLLLVWFSDPFAPSPRHFAQGMGLNPLLENPMMVIHPPVVFIGYAGFSVPFAYAVAALLMGQLGEEWLRKVRRWVLFAWAFLGAGIIIGGWWAYMELGWGGYWSWDPVENSSL